MCTFVYLILSKRYQKTLSSEILFFIVFYINLPQNKGKVYKMYRYQLYLILLYKFNSVPVQDPKEDFLR